MHEHHHVGLHDTVTSSRDESLDALRALAVLAGIALHSVIPYMVVPVPELLWPIHDSTRHQLSDVVFWWGRCAQAQTFFLIAGFVSMQMYGVRGPRRFVGARVERLGVPLLAAVLTVLPVVAVVWAWGWVESGRATWAEAWSWRFADPEIQRNRLGPGHLWFLVDLLIISVLFAAWRFHRPPRTGRSRSGGVALAALASASAVIVALQPHVLFEARNTFVPDPWRIAYGVTFFAGGLWLASHRDAWRAWPRARYLVMMAALAAAAVTYVVASGPADWTGRLAMASAASAVSWLSLVAGIRAVSRVGFSLPAVGRPLAALAYPIYVIHLPLVGAAQLLVASTGLSAPVKALCVFTGALALSWLLAAAAAPLADRWRRLAARLSQVRPRVWTTTAIAMGIALRVAHYVRNPDVWHDEAAMLVNLVERSYTRLLEPLTYHEAGPPLFLWIERWMVMNVGDDTWALRVVPLVASCAALVLLGPMSRAMRPSAAPFALILMACSPQLVRHSVEAKPYAVDVLLATAVGSAYLMTRHWRVTRRLMLWTIATPLLVWASYPGVFLVGGVAAALIPEILRERHTKTLIAVAVWVVVAALCFAGLLLGPIDAQRDAAIYEAWRWAFAAGSDPVSVITWLARSVVGIADYCFRPIGGVLLLPIAFGILSLMRRGERELVRLLVTPIVLAAVAGLFRQYPFSGSRVMIYALPALSVLAAEGLGDLFSRIPERKVLLRATALALTVLPPIVLSGRDAFAGWRRPETAAAATMVRSAWRPGDRIASSAWEYRYYLRDRPGDFVSLNEQPLPIDAARVWWLVHGPTPDSRRAWAASIAGEHYDAGVALDLHGVSVVELSRRP